MMTPLPTNAFLLLATAASASRTSHLLVNPLAVDSSEGVHLAVGNATRLERPLLAETRPWDVDWGNAYPNVAYDHSARRYQMWWGGLSACPPNYARLQPGCHPGATNNFSGCVCPVPSYKWRQWRPKQNVTTEWSLTFYAESRDGLNWSRPNLNLLSRGLPFAGGTASSDVVVWAPASDLNRGTFLDLHTTNTSERYKMIGSFTDGSVKGVPTSVVGTAVSSDGQSWGPVRPIVGPGWTGFHGPNHTEQPVSIKCDSHMNAIYDESQGVYLAFVRVQPPPSCLEDDPKRCLFHRIGVARSHDFVTWEPPVQILVGDSEQTNLTYVSRCLQTRPLPSPAAATAAAAAAAAAPMSLRCPKALRRCFSLLQLTLDPRNGENCGSRRW